MDRLSHSQRSILAFLVVTFFGFAVSLVNLQSGLIVSVGLAVCIVAITFPLVALSLLTILIVANLSHNLILAFGAPSIAKLAIPGLVLLLLARYLMYGDRPYFGWRSFSFIVLIISVQLLGAFYAHDWSVTLEAIEDFLRTAVVALLALSFMRYDQALETFAKTAALTVAACCALGIVSFVGIEIGRALAHFAYFNPFHGRFGGPVQDANFFAIIVVFVLPLAFVQALQARNFLRGIGWFLVTLLLLFGLAMSQSRGGILALSIALFVMLPALSARQRNISLVVISFIAALAVMFLSDELTERFATLGDIASGNIDKSVEGRLASWIVAIELFKSFPFLGVGTGNFNSLFQDYALSEGLIFRGEGRSAHSLYLEILAENGMVGFAVFIAMLMAGLVYLLRAIRLAWRAGETRLYGFLVAYLAGYASYLFGMVLLHDSYPRYRWIVIVLAIESLNIVRLRLAKAQDEQDN